MDALWDTGATVSLIHAKMVRNLKLKTMNTEGMRKHKITALVMEKQAPCELVIGMDFITKEGLSFTLRGEEWEIWDERQNKHERIYTTKGKKFLRRYREQKKILSFKAKVRNKRVHKVETYMSKVSKEDRDFLYLLTHLKVKNIEEGVRANIIQCMEERYELPTQRVSESGTAPVNPGAAALSTVPSEQDATPTTDERPPSGNPADSTVTCKDTVPQSSDVTPGGNGCDAVPSQGSVVPGKGAAMA